MTCSQGSFLLDSRHGQCCRCRLCKPHRPTPSPDARPSTAQRQGNAQGLVGPDTAQASPRSASRPPLHSPLEPLPLGRGRRPSSREGTPRVAGWWEATCKTAPPGVESGLPSRSSRRHGTVSKKKDDPEEGLLIGIVLRVERIVRRLRHAVRADDHRVQALLR